MDIQLLLHDTFQLFLLPESWMIIATLFLLEGILSLDNATVLAGMVRGLSEKDQRKALAYGMAGAFGFRILALFFVQQLAVLVWLKVLGGLYLIWLVFDYFMQERNHEQLYKHGFKVLTSIVFIFLVYGDTSFTLYEWKINVVILGKIILGLFCAYLLTQMHRSFRRTKQINQQIETGDPIPGPLLVKKSLLWTIVSIELADLAFSIDNVFVAVGVTNHLPLIIIGVCLGIVAMRFIAKQINRLIEKYPLLDVSAHLVIALVGVKMILSYVADIYPDSMIHAVMHAHGLELYTSSLTILIFIIPIIRASLKKR